MIKEKTDSLFGQKGLPDQVEVCSASNSDKIDLVLFLSAHTLQGLIVQVATQ